MKKNETIELLIDGMMSDGNAIGHYEGKAVFVPNAAVGDFLQVKIVKDNKSYAFGRMETIIKPSKFRQEIDCAIANVCGGCCFRHITYEAELLAKQGFVQDALTRLGKLDILVEPIVASPNQARYRNKAQIPVAEQNNEWVYGFYAARSHRIVPCEDCLLQPKEVNEITFMTMKLLQEFGCSAYNENTKKGLIRHIYIRQGGNSKEILLCIVATARTIPNSALLVKSLTDAFPMIKTIVLNVNKKDTNVILGDTNITLFGDGFIQDSILHVPLRLGVHSFSQVNTLGAQRLFEIAKKYANVDKSDILLDLYCGAGVIGLSMAGSCKQLIGVEIVPEAIENANHSASLLGVLNARFICEDAAKAAKMLEKEQVHPNVIVLDPPRKGCDEATLQTVLAMQAERIVMVSCNPATLARDLNFLTKNEYKLEKVQPVDMFPRTKHVEAVALLTKMK